MTDVRKRVECEKKDRLTFGIGKPKLFIKMDMATQTDEENYEYQGTVIQV